MPYDPVEKQWYPAHGFALAKGRRFLEEGEPPRERFLGRYDRRQGQLIGPLNDRDCKE